MIILSLCFSSEKHVFLDMLIPCLMVEEVELGAVRILLIWNFGSYSALQTSLQKSWSAKIMH